MKCEVCKVELPAEKCIFAQQKRIINGVEHTFCCIHCADVFEKEKISGKKGRGKKGSKKRGA